MAADQQKSAATAEGQADRPRRPRRPAPPTTLRHVHEGLLRHPGRVHRLHDQGHGRHGRLSISWRQAPTRATGPFVTGTGQGRWRRTVRAGRLARGHVQQRLERRLPGHASRSATRMWTSSTRCPPSLNMAAAPGLQNTWTKSSNTVQGAIGLGDTYRRLSAASDWGKFKFGDDVHALQDLDRPAESLRRGSWATTPRSWATPAATTAWSSVRAWIT